MNLVAQEPVGEKSWWKKTPFNMQVWKLDSDGRRTEQFVANFFVPRGYDSMGGKYTTKGELSSDFSDYSLHVQVTQNYNSDNRSRLNQAPESAGSATLEVKRTRVNGEIRVPLFFQKSGEEAFVLNGEFRGAWRVDCAFLKDVERDTDPPRTTYVADHGKQSDFCRQFRKKPWPMGYR